MPTFTFQKNDVIDVSDFVPDERRPGFYIARVIEEIVEEVEDDGND